MNTSPRAVLLAVCATVFFGVLNASAVNVVLPSLGDEFGVGPGDLGQVMSMFLLVYGVAIPVYGRVADRLGSRRPFLFGVALFSLGSMACAAAGSFEGLLIARVVQGLGGAAFPGLGMALVSQASPPASRGTALGYVAATLGAGAAVGPLVGGVMADQVSWRLLFAVSAMALLVLPFAWRALPRQSPEAGETPSLRSVLGIAPYRRAVSMSFLTTGSYLALLIGLPLMLSAELGLSPSQVGFVLLPEALATAVMGVVAGRLADRVGFRIPPALGAAALAVVALGLYALGDSSVAGIVALGALMGGGYALINTPVAAAIGAMVDPRVLASALSLNAMCLFIGGAIGTTAFVQLAEAYDFGVAFAAFTLPMLVVAALALSLPRANPLA